MQIFNTLFIATLIFVFPHLVVGQQVATVKIPGTSVSFKLVALPAGTYQMGSPESEQGRGTDEGLHEVVLDSFWVGACEVTWDEFNLYQFKHMDSDSSYAVNVFKADAIARPSPPYFDFTYGRGRIGGYPASTMTQQSALRYCQWLSNKTGDFYRLPTEAEWEYACRAGTQTTWAWGQEIDKAIDYAWFYENSSGSYQKVGTKKPNAWGLYDMHGNVWEWCQDSYEKYGGENDLIRKKGKAITKNNDNRLLRGGSWFSNAQDCRSACRYSYALELSSFNGFRVVCVVPF